MATLFYGSSRIPVLVEERTLAHLRTLISSKLRRNECFMLSWKDAEAIGNGNSSVWIHPQMDLHFKFDDTRPALDREYLEAMGNAASSTTGLELGDATLVWDPRPTLDPALENELAEFRDF